MLKCESSSSGDAEDMLERMMTCMERFAAGKNTESRRKNIWKRRRLRHNTASSRKQHAGGDEEDEKDEKAAEEAERCKKERSNKAADCEN